MRIAFYAPLKSPTHPIPSGDRLIATMFVTALERAGHEVSQPLRLRTWDGTGDASRQRRIASIGSAMAQRIVRRHRADPAHAPELWFTYHVYHKAPDWCGPAVGAALGIPYVVAEGSVAHKQRDGRWREGHAAAVAAIRAADEVICLNPRDVPGVADAREGLLPPVQLAPFFDVDAFLSKAHAGDGQGAFALADALPRDSPRLIAVAMMRHGGKLDSYRSLAASLTRLVHRRWHLVIAGDGNARDEVHAAFAHFAPGRVHFTGTLPRATLGALLATCDLFLWPAIAEVIGMVLVEAQACGVPVIAGHGPGVAAVVQDGIGGVLVPAGDDAAFAQALDALLTDADRRRAMALRAREYVRSRHDLPAASVALDRIVARVLRQHRSVRAP